MKRTATLLLALIVAAGVYAGSYLSFCPPASGIRRQPWTEVVERRSKVGDFCEVLYAPCIWVEWQLLISENLDRAEGEWVTRDGLHRLEVRRMRGNRFELRSGTGWLDGAVQVKGGTPGCGPMVVSEDGVSLYVRPGTPLLGVTVAGQRGTFVRPL